MTYFYKKNMFTKFNILITSEKHWNERAEYKGISVILIFQFLNWGVADLHSLHITYMHLCVSNDI